MPNMNINKPLAPHYYFFVNQGKGLVGKFFLTWGEGGRYTAFFEVGWDIQENSRLRCYLGKKLS
jgi:hypothetical protein